MGYEKLEKDIIESMGERIESSCKILSEKENLQRIADSLEKNTKIIKAFAACLANDIANNAEKIGFDCNELRDLEAKVKNLTKNIQNF